MNNNVTAGIKILLGKKTIEKENCGSIICEKSHRTNSVMLIHYNKFNFL